MAIPGPAPTASTYGNVKKQNFEKRRPGIIMEKRLETWNETEKQNGEKKDQKRKKICPKNKTR
jgi:hypothetical protein